MRVSSGGVSYEQSVVGDGRYRRVVGTVVTAPGWWEFRFEDGGVDRLWLERERLGEVSLYDANIWGGPARWVVYAKRPKKGANRRASQHRGDYAGAFKKFRAIVREIEGGTA